MVSLAAWRSVAKPVGRRSFAFRPPVYEAKARRNSGKIAGLGRFGRKCMRNHPCTVHARLDCTKAARNFVNRLRGYQTVNNTARRPLLCDALETVAPPAMLWGMRGIERLRWAHL